MVSYSGSREIYPVSKPIPSFCRESVWIGNRARRCHLDRSPTARDWRQRRPPIFLLQLLLLQLSFAGMLSFAGFADDEPRRVLRESRFEEAVTRPLIADGERPQLRAYLQRLARDRELALLLDRRIDPEQQVAVAIRAATFVSGLRELVGQLPAEVTTLGDTLIVGPVQPVRQLRTRVWIARQQLDELGSFTPKRQFELLRRYPLAWEELATPREILEQIATRYKLTVTNIDRLPHDLWPAGQLAYPNSIEALTVLLSQFELSFAWVDAQTIQLIDQPAEVAILQTHRPRGMTMDQALERVLDQFPHLQIRQQGAEFAFAGLVEEHELVALLIGARTAPRMPPVPTEVTPLRDRRFTLKMVRKPFGSLMATLQQQGIDVRYDAAALAAAQVDLTQNISLELEQATIDLLLLKACELVGLNYEIRDEVIHLIPAR